MKIKTLVLALLAVVIGASAVFAAAIPPLIENGGNPTWLRHSGTIVFDRMGEDGFFDIFTAKADGKEQKNITVGKEGLPQMNIGKPCFNQVTDFLAFQVQDPELSFSNMPPFLVSLFSSPNIGFHNNIWICDKEAKIFKKLTTVMQFGGTYNPQFSLDGRKLAWNEFETTSEGKMVWSIKIGDFIGEGGVTSVKTITPELAIFSFESFSPDGKFMLLTGIEKIDVGNIDSEIYLLDVESKKLTKLTDNTDQDSFPRFTLDGNSIIWATTMGIDNNVTGLSDYWIMNKDGSNRRRMTYYNSKSSPDYVPRGAYASSFEFGPDSKNICALVKVGNPAAMTGHENMLIPVPQN